MATDLILGTAGHIDHGKTSLIRALTGVDTDRLPEEKKRGITIDLGFAELLLGDFRLGIVDVPGHERFVRNMLAGATGMDLALLVVAADDSIKPQTREHLEILRLLNLEAGVIALTKCDLVETGWLDLVELEIGQFVAGTFLAEAPLVRTSTHTGAGLDQLRQCLADAARRAARSSRSGRIAGPFRLPIDRTFTIAGHGTVVTGSVASGQAVVGDELTIEPGGVAVRVRGLQNHDRPVQQVQRGQRAAINLGGVHHDEITRGQELATPGHLRPSRLLTVRLSLIASASRPLKSRSRARLHLGTAELLTSVRLLDRDRLEPGETGLAQLFLRDPAVTTWSQPFVLRSESPVVTIGGGVVLEPNAEKIRHADGRMLAMLTELTASDSLIRASAALYLAGLRDWQPEDLARTAGVEDTATVYTKLLERGDLLEIPVSPTRSFRLHRFVFEDLCERVVATLLKLHQQQPLRITVDRALLANRLTYVGEPALLEAALVQLQSAGRVRLSQHGVALVGQGPKLSQNEQKLLSQIIDQFRVAGLKPPTIRDCQQQATKNRESVPQLVSLAVASGDVVQIAPDFYLHADVEREIRRVLAEKLAAGSGMALSEIREILGTTRKYVVPLCEYYDKIGFTIRQGDLRVLNLDSG